MDVIDRFERVYQELGQGSVDELADVYDEQIIFVDPVAEHDGLPAGARQRRWDGSVNQDGASTDAGLVT
jgi:hypothetical protein